MKRIFFAILLLFLIPNIAFAFEKRSGNFVNVASDEVVEGSLFVYADVFDIDGVVNGDVFCLSPEIEISGTVNGDIICAGEHIYFSGTTTGDMRLISSKVRLGGKVLGNTNIISDQLEVRDIANHSGEFFLLANNAILDGTIDGDLYGGVQRADISSFVGGNISLRQGDGLLSSTDNHEFKLLGGATVLGNFNLKSRWDLFKDESVIIKGEENVQVFKEKKVNYSNSIFWALVSIFSNILIALVLIALFKNFFLSVSEIIIKQSSKSFWLGLLIFFLAPLTLILLFLTVIGIPLALILLFIFGGIIIINKSIISIILGEKIVKLFKRKKKISLNVKAVFGALVFYSIATLPFIGSVFSFMSLIIVFGAILQYFRKNLSK